MGAFNFTLSHLFYEANDLIKEVYSIALLSTHELETRESTITSY